jgi:diacylglycerol kinase (ATP)
MDEFLTKKNFSIIARARSFKHAFRGVGIMIRTQHNAWVHMAAAMVAIVLGFYLNITLAEWAVLALAMGFVLASEAFNTAMEIDIDLTSPTYHPYARDTKDVAAGAVLISVIVASVIGLIIFLPKIILLF